jgi:hypothetical protein
VASATGPSTPGRSWTPTTAPPTSSANADTAKPLRNTGSDRPGISGRRGAGVVKTMLSVRRRRSSFIVPALANRHGTAPYWSALPMTKNSSDPIPVPRPM